MGYTKFTLFFAFFFFFCTFSFAFAQDEYEAVVDSAWIASQNGGSTEFNNGEVNEPTPNCIGDGCDGTEPAAVSDSSISQIQASDSTAKKSCESDSCKAKIAVIDSDEYEDCTEADSANTECIVIEEDSNDSDNYIEENAEQYRARKEGFSRSIQLGIRAFGGINNLFGKKADDWGFGYEFGGGILIRMPIGIRHLSLVPELDFVYRNYSYENKNDYSKNKANIDLLLFEIPILLRYTFDEDNFFVGIGMNINLKLSGSSKFKQELFDSSDKETRNNSLPTNGVELGGTLNLGYSITRWLVIDIRATQCFTNLLNKNSVAESSMTKAQLYSFYTVLGFTFAF